MESFFSERLLFSGFASVLMVALLPGLALAKTGIYPSGWLRLPIVFCVSLTLHFQFMFYLTLIGAYRIEVLSLASLSMISWIVLSAKHSVISAEPMDSTFIEQRQSMWLHLLSKIVALAATAYLLMRIATEIPGVFMTWDAVVSWNRWAQDWFMGHLPRNTYGYPQLIPGAWAGTYVWLGSSRIETWAKGLMAVFPLAVIAIYADMHVRLRSSAALFATAIWVIVLMAAFPELIDSGYVDVPVAFFILLTAYLLLLVQKEKLSVKPGLALAAIAAAGAVLTKQSGWLAVVMLAWSILSSLRTSEATHRQGAKLAAVILACLVGPWYVYKYFEILVNTDPSNFTFVTSTIYAGESLHSRLIRALTVNTPAAFSALVHERWRVPMSVLCVISMLAAFQKPLGRVCWLAVIFPYYFVWALFFSYDMRNLMPAIPFAALGLGIGLETIGERFSLRFPFKSCGKGNTTSNRWHVKLSGRIVIFTLLSLLSITLLFPVSRQNLILSNHALRRNSGNPGLNSFLIEHLSKAEFQGKILSTYTPLAAIDGIKEHIYFHPESPTMSAAFIDAFKVGAPICQVVGLVPHHKELRYFLLPRSFYTEMFDKGIANGSLQLVHEAADMRFLEISCPPEMSNSLSSGSSIGSNEHPTS